MAGPDRRLAQLSRRKGAGSAFYNRSCQRLKSWLLWQGLLRCELHSLNSCCWHIQYSTIYPPTQSTYTYDVQGQCSSVTLAVSMIVHHTVHLCLVTIKYKNPSWTNITVPQKYVFDFKEKIFPLNNFTFHRLIYIFWKYIFILEIRITWFQKELATPRFKIPHMNFKKEILVPFRKILVPIQNYQGLSFLPVTFTGLADWFPQLGSWHGQLCGSIMHKLWWSSDKILTWDVMGPEFKSSVLCLLLFHDDILGSLGSNLVFIIPFGIMLFLTEYHEWLWNYFNEIWERVLANSFSGIYKSKIICSACTNLQTILCSNVYAI